MKGWAYLPGFEDMAPCLLLCRDMTMFRCQTVLLFSSANLCPNRTGGEDVWWKCRRDLKDLLHLCNKSWRRFAGKGCCLYARPGLHLIWVLYGLHGLLASHAGYLRG